MKIVNDQKITLEFTKDDVRRAEIAAECMLERELPSGPISRTDVLKLLTKMYIHGQDVGARTILSQNDWRFGRHAVTTQMPN